MLLELYELHGQMETYGYSLCKLRAEHVPVTQYLWNCACARFRPLAHMHVGICGVVSAMPPSVMWPSGPTPWELRAAAAPLLGCLQSPCNAPVVPPRRVVCPVRSHTNIVRTASCETGCEAHVSTANHERWREGVHGPNLRDRIGL